MSSSSAVFALVLLNMIVWACLLAPVYSRHVTGIDPFVSNISGKVEIAGVEVSVLQPNTEGLGLGSTPIGPTWDITKYFLGADSQGRDVAGRLLYGGRNSLLIAAAASVITLTIACILGVMCGLLGRWFDLVVSRIFDILWAFPIYLLAISLSIVLISEGIQIGPFTLAAGSLWLPIWIIGIVYVPYVARPIRAQVLVLRESEFVLAARVLGIPTHRILLVDILPNVLTTIVAFMPITLALSILTESALSFLSIGVQPPDASWGTIIQDGLDLLYTRPLVAIAPGFGIVATVIALNMLGEALQKEVDPRQKLKAV